MTTERDPRTRTVLSWLREDAHENAERVLLRALDEVDATPQRRSWLPARRSTQMNRLFLAASAAAAVLAVAIVGYGLLPVSNPGGQATVMPSTAPTSSPGRTRTGPPLLPNGPLAGGTYLMLPFSSPLASLRVTLTVPDGWEGYPPGAVTPAAGPGGPDGGAVALLLVTALYSDPCRADTGGPLIPAGDTVDDLVLAFAEVRGRYNVGSPRDVTVGGHSGKRIALVIPSNLDFATCERGQYWIWDPGPWAQGPGNRWDVWILDVDGTRVVILGHDFPGTSATDQIQIQDVVSSIVIEP
jgi:hypothetical protein